MQPFKAFRIGIENGQHHAGFDTIMLDTLTPGDVVVKAEFSGINYKDALAATGQGRILKKFPLVGGIDVCGHVARSETASFKPHDPVLICGCGLSETIDGGYAEYVRVPADCVVPLPAGLTLFQSMAIGSAGFTAALAIDRMQINGQIPALGPIAVTGASGGVGSFAIDLLARLGFEVIAITGKSESRQYLESLGASKILLRQSIKFGSQPLEKSIWGGAIDNVGGELLSGLTRTVNSSGNIAAIGLAGGTHIQTTVMPFILRGISLLGINSVNCPKTLRTRIWKRLSTSLRPHRIDRIVTRKIAFSQLPQQFDRYLKGENIGRTVVNIAGNRNED